MKRGKNGNVKKYDIHLINSKKCYKHFLLIFSFVEERELCYICIFLLVTLLNSGREKNLVGKCISLILYFYYKFVFIMFVNAFTMSIKKYANQFNRKELIQNSFSESITITMAINLISSFLEKKIKIIRKIIRKNQF